MRSGFRFLVLATTEKQCSCADDPLVPAVPAYRHPFAGSAASGAVRARRHDHLAAARYGDLVPHMRAQIDDVPDLAFDRHFGRLARSKRDEILGPDNHRNVGIGTRIAEFGPGLKLDHSVAAPPG